LRRSEQTHEVEIDKLHFGLSPRNCEQDPEHVVVLAGILSTLPPITVHAPSMLVIDGVHRVLAARSVGRKTIPAVFFHGTETDAALQAIYFNVAHGKPLTFAEREAAASKVLRMHPTWSDRRIATICGVSPKTVARLRTESMDVGAETRGRVGRDGKMRAVDPVAVRERIAEALRANPNASNRSIAAENGTSHRTVRDVRERLERGDDILSPRLAARRQQEEEAAPLRGDRALTSLPGGAAFTDWLESRMVASDDEWLPFVETVPVSRVYELADTARRCAGTWQRLASALEDRISRTSTMKGMSA
jgi:ParB-like chromosome segregation protein Spo0J